MCLYCLYKYLCISDTAWRAVECVCIVCISASVSVTQHRGLWSVYCLYKYLCISDTTWRTVECVCIVCISASVSVTQHRGLWSVYCLYNYLCINDRAWSFVCWLLADCLMSQQHANVSQRRICTDNFACCHTEIKAAYQTFHLTQSQYTDTVPTSSSTGSWQSSHWSANFLSYWYDSTPQKSRRKRDSNPGSSALEADALTTKL